MLAQVLKSIGKFTDEEPTLGDVEECRPNALTFLYEARHEDKKARRPKRHRESAFENLKAIAHAIVAAIGKGFDSSEILPCESLGVAAIALAGATGQVPMC